MNILTSRRANVIRHRTALPATLIAAVVLVFMAMTTTELTSRTNLLNILNQQSSLASVTLGQLMVILTGGLDLSVGSVVSLSTALCSIDAPDGVGMFLAIAAAVLVGAVNAIGVTRLKIHPILMTLSTMTATQGVALLIRPVPGGVVPSVLGDYTNGAFLGVPLPVYGMVAILATVYYLVHKTRFGLHLFAVGAILENAKLSGVRTERTIALAYLLSAVLSCIGGIALSGRIGGGDPLVGMTFATDSIAAVALGGVMLSGGMGSVFGPMAGLAVLALLGSLMNYWNVSAYYQMIIKGFLLLAAVSVHRRKTVGL